MNRFFYALIFLLCTSNTSRAQAQYAKDTDFPHEAFTKHTSIKKLTKQAHKGDVDAQFQLGHDYYWGLVAADGLRDYKTARIWLAMAAANGHGEAQTYLGRIYRYGRGVDVDLAAAHTYYCQSMRNGFNDAYFDLGEMMIEEGYPQKDIQKGLDYILRAAEGGSINAQLYLAKEYFSGINLPQDYKKSLYWSEMTAKQNSQTGHFIAGYIYAKKLVDDKDAERKALEYYKKGASIGDPISQYYIAQCYYYGDLSLETDSLKYLYWLRKSADSGLAMAQHELGDHLYVNGNSRKDSVDAFKYTQKAAENGYAASQNLLGCMYHEGFAIQKDQIKALEFFRKSAAQGNPHALSNMGIYYADGYGGLKRDVYMAYKYYGEALQAGADNMKESIKQLADIGSDEANEEYHKGVQLEKDIESGKEENTPANLDYLWLLYFDAAEKGNSYAQYEIGFRYNKGLGIEKNQEKAFLWYKKAVDNGNTNAISNLAYMYINGIGTKTDSLKAFELYHMDAMMGNDVDQYNTGLYYRYGWCNVKKDLEEARRWFQKSADQGYENAKKQLNALENSGGSIIKSISADAGNTIMQIKKERRIALIVGNQNYNSKPLRNVLNDANAMKRKLSLLGFDDVRILRNATKISLDTCVTRFANDARGFDVALFFYSGHGIQINNENYLLPIDIDMHSDEYAGDMCTKLSGVFDKMEKSSCPIKIAIIDACRDNPFDNVKTKGAGTTGGLADVQDTPDGMYIVFSTMPGKTASDGKPEDKNSPFTRALLELMGQPGLEINQIFNRVGSLVEKYTGHSQRPHRQTTLTNDFYFNKAEKVYSK